MQGEQIGLLQQPRQIAPGTGAEIQKRLLHGALVAVDREPSPDARRDRAERAEEVVDVARCVADSREVEFQKARIGLHQQRHRGRSLGDLGAAAGRVARLVPCR